MKMKVPSVMVFIYLFVIIGLAQGGYAPKESPKLPEGFCPKETGTITATTGGTCQAVFVDVVFL